MVSITTTTTLNNQQTSHLYKMKKHLGFEATETVSKSTKLVEKILEMGGINVIQLQWIGWVIQRYCRERERKGYLEIWNNEFIS